jgi:hypothetical protein
LIDQQHQSPASVCQYDQSSLLRLSFAIFNAPNKSMYMRNLHPNLKNKYLDLSHIVIQLCSLDKNFPPPDLWNYYYDCKNLSDIIKLKIYKKKIFNIK